MTLGCDRDIDLKVLASGQNESVSDVIFSY